jgi:hypothetical protein
MDQRTLKSGRAINPRYAATAPETDLQKRDRENQELVEGIAQNISALASAADALLNGKLKRKAIVILLAHSCNLPQRQVDAVLTALMDLRKDWINSE